MSNILRSGLLGVAVLLIGISGCMAPPDSPRQDASERLVIAHHMNAALPAKAGGQDALAHGSSTPTSRAQWAEYGGRLRDMSLTTLYDFPHRKSVKEQIAWEIEVAQRSGIDAFAFYGVLPQQEARVLEYMKAAAGKGFKITLCQSGGERGSKYEEAAEALKRLVEIDETMNALLRVDGKLLLPTYGGNWGKPDDTSPTVEEMIAKRKDLEARVGTPLLILYAPQSITTSGHIRNHPEKIAELYATEREKLSALFEGGFDGLSPFLIVADERTEADCRFWMELCKEYGKLYYQPVSLQFHSSKYMTHAPVGDSIWNRSWGIAEAGADGVQLVTWNDWGESTAMAPGINVNYGLHTLLKQEAQRFKNGTRQVMEEKAWVFYYRYPSAATPRLFPQRVLHWKTKAPRQFRFPEHDWIWVRTELNAPATVACEGRGEKQVEAGIQLTAFPLTPGPVRITIQRGGKTIHTLSPPEVVTDKPWRVDHSLVVFGNDDDEREYRKQDFPGQAPRYYGEYGDDDSDGLMNWFEGLYFSVLESPATSVTGTDSFNDMSCQDAQAKMVNPLQRDTALDLKEPVAIDFKLASRLFAAAVWRQRYHWNAAGLREEADGIAIFNPKDHTTRESYFFYDSVPNPTYGPNGFYGDTVVSADITFNFGKKPDRTWGSPGFSLLSRVSPGRESMVYFNVAVTGKDTAKLTLGWSQRKKWSPAKGEVLAETAIQVPANGEFEISLATVTVDKDKVNLTGICQWADGSNQQTLTAEHAVKDSGIQSMGEIGFSAKLHEFKDTPDSPNHILLKALGIKNQK